MSIAFTFPASLHLHMSQKRVKTHARVSAALQAGLRTVERKPSKVWQAVGGVVVERRHHLVRRCERIRDRRCQVDRLTGEHVIKVAGIGVRGHMWCEWRRHLSGRRHGKHPFKTQSPLTGLNVRVGNVSKEQDKASSCRPSTL